jgi:hypothetical protein
LPETAWKLLQSADKTPRHAIQAGNCEKPNYEAGASTEKKCETAPQSCLAL